MILRPMANFSGNGVLRGTITALDDFEEPLGFESYGNWSDRTFVEKSARQLADTTGIPLDRALTLLTRAVQEARRVAGLSDSGVTRPQPPENELPVVEISKIANLGRSSRMLGMSSRSPTTGTPSFSPWEAQ